MLDFSRLSDGRILDLRPTAEGNPPLVLTPDGWIPFDGTLGEVNDSVPLSKEEITSLLTSLEKNNG